MWAKRKGERTLDKTDTKLNIQYFTDLALAIGLIIAIVIGSWIVASNMRENSVSMGHTSGRKIDLDRIREQISEGELSDKEAVFYQKIEIKR